MFVIINGIQCQQNQVQGANQALDELIHFYFSRQQKPFNSEFKHHENVGKKPVMIDREKKNQKKNAMMRIRCGISDE